MSADLFAEFGTDPTPNHHHQQQPVASTKQGSQSTATFSLFDGLNPPGRTTQSRQPQSSTQNFESFTSAPTQAAATDDNDDWGDFEGESSFETAPPAKHDPFAFGQPQAPQPLQSSWNITPAAQDSFAFSSNQPSPSIQETWQSAPIVKAKKSADPSVLFDAEENLDDDDDFGDFEDAQNAEPALAPAPPATRTTALNDLLGDLSVSQPSQSKPPVTSESQDASANRTRQATIPPKKGSVSGFGTISSNKQLSAKPAPAVSKEEDAWDTFDDWEASIPTKAPAKLSKKPDVKEVKTSSKSLSIQAPILSPTIDDPQPGELPPTNVPPPGVLLSLFPSLFAEAHEKLFKPMAAQTLPMRNKLLAELATITYLQGYLILANVAAHIIAGRKLRWKRDQHLSQGMRIGPASSRATSGMKLTGIDKGENMKEEREVSDVVRVWKEQVGRLRHVVSGANQIKSGTLGPVPDLQDTMPVKTLKQSEGGIPARQPCMMCGLKREERVTAGDLAVDDSFGEWWIDQVNMHRGEYPLAVTLLRLLTALLGCRNFWNEHRDRLRQR